MNTRLSRIAWGIGLAFGVTLTLAPLSHAQQVPGPPPAPTPDTPATQAAPAQRVEITGSSIKRIEAETALPVQVITREEIQRSGVTTVEQLLQQVSAATSSMAMTASMSAGATTGSLSSVSLRGLSSLRTLVLLNGRRIAPYGIGFTGDSVSVDVNSIPIAAIERVDVLKDGASAIYGSDAIAGVVNFILRRDVQGLELGAEYGDTQDGGASLKRATAVWGFGDADKDRYRVTLVGSFQKEGSLFGRDRDFSRSATNLRFQNDTTSGNTFPANIAAVDGSFGSLNPTAPQCPGPYSTYVPFRSDVACRFDPAPLVQLLPASERTSLFASLRFAITNNVEGYAEASINRNKQDVIIQPVPLSDQFTIPLNNPLADQAPYNQYTTFPSATIVLQPTSPFYPTAFVQQATGGATPDLLVRYRAGESGNRHLQDVSEAPRLVIGARGIWSGWDFDTNFLHSTSKVKETVIDGFPIYSRILPLLNSGTVNFFAPNTPQVVEQIRAANFTGTAFSVNSTLDSLQAKVSHDLTELPGGPLAVAIGAEGRHEKYEFSASQELQTGDVSGFGGTFNNVDRSRKVASLFTEFNVPVIKGLEANAAVRFDKYQGVGNSTTPKFSLRWQPIREVLLRASVGKGFRAPSLQDLYLPPQQSVTPPGVSDPIRCPVTGDQVKDCGTQFNVLFQGTPTLKPERSQSSTVGLVLEPNDVLSVALDAFRIKLRDQITNGVNASAILADADAIARFGNLVLRGAPDPAFPDLPGPIIQIDQSNLNLGQVRLTGIDFDAKARFAWPDIGRVTLGYTGTYFVDYDSENPDGSFSPVIGVANSATGGVVPRLKTNLSASLSTHDWVISANYNWQSRYEDVGNAPFFDLPLRKVSPYETVDAQLQYKGLHNTTLTLGARNVFNKAPPYTNAGGQTSFQSGYDPTYADPRGRFIYGRVNYTFD
jgi:iron complex outermembrane recepter protein